MRRKAKAVIAGLAIAAGVGGCAGMEPTTGWAGFNACLSNHGLGTTHGGTLDLADHAQQTESVGPSGRYGRAVGDVDFDPSGALAATDATSYNNKMIAAGSDPGLYIEQQGRYLIQWVDSTPTQRNAVRACARDAS